MPGGLQACASCSHGVGAVLTISTERRATPLPTPTWEGSDDELLNVEQAAALLTVRPSTLRYWARERRVPVVRLGPRHLRWTRPLLREIRDAHLDRGGRL